MYGLSSFFPHEKKKKREKRNLWLSLGVMWPLPIGLARCRGVLPQGQRRHNVSLSGCRTGQRRHVSHTVPSQLWAAALPSFPSVRCQRGERPGCVEFGGLRWAAANSCVHDESKVCRRWKKKKEKKKSVLMSIKFSRRLLKIEAVACIKYWLGTSILYAWMNFNVPFYAFRNSTTHVHAVQVCDWFALIFLCLRLYWSKAHLNLAHVRQSAAKMTGVLKMMVIMSKYKEEAQLGKQVCIRKHITPANTDLSKAGRVD